MVQRALPWLVFVGVAALGSGVAMTWDDGREAEAQAATVDAAAPAPAADATAPGPDDASAAPAPPTLGLPAAPEGLVLPFGMTWDDVAPYAAAPARPAGLTGISPTPLGLDPPADPTLGDRLPWQSSLSAREQALVRTQQALLGEMERLGDLQKKIEARWVDADEARRFAEDACGGPVISAGPATGTLPLTADERETNLRRVADIVRKMKVKKAAAVILEWDDVLAIEVLGRLASREVTPILSAMPADDAGRLTRRMVSGPGHLRTRAAADPGGAP